MVSCMYFRQFLRNQKDAKVTVIATFNYSGELFQTTTFPIRNAACTANSIQYFSGFKHQIKPEHPFKLLKSIGF